MTKKQPSSQPGLYRSLAVLVGVILFIVLALIPNYPRNSSPEVEPQVIATMNPTIIANLTTVPRAQALTGIEAQKLHDLQQQVDACADYGDERRSQMQQHIRWLLNPSTIPPDILIAAGQNPLGRLVFGMAVYTSTAWRLQNRPQNSCLIAIGRTLNEMLLEAGETPLTIYDE